MGTTSRNDEINEGLSLLAELAPDQPAKPYQLQAAIAAEHAKADRAVDTDWAAIAAIYTELSA